MENYFITGVSSGIGHALAEFYLKQGHRVFGVSRRQPDDLSAHANFVFRSLDLTNHQQVQTTLAEIFSDATFFAGQPESDKVIRAAILNAGILGQISDMRTIDLERLKHLMDVNVWSNKTVIDSLFSLGMTIKQVVTISSGAAVNGNRGWNGYSISKAALNMLTSLYAGELPEAHFAALAPGLVDTAMQDYLCANDSDDRFPSLEVLKSKRNTEEMPSPKELAPRLAATIERLPQLTESGGFIDIRNVDFQQLQIR